MIRYAITRIKLAYYTRALQEMGVSHPDSGAVLLHISALRDRLQGF